MQFSFKRPSDVNDDLDEEFEVHLRLLTEEQIDLGATPEEALLYARCKLGNKAVVREAVYELWTFARLESFVMQFWSTLRTLIRNPIFSVVTILILSLGIGGGIGIIAIVDIEIFHALPYQNARQLVEIVTTSPKDLQEHISSVAEFKEWEKHGDIFSAVAAVQGDLFVITGNGRPEQVEGDAVGANLTTLLGVRPILGHSFEDAGQGSSQNRIALISWRLWHERFHEDSRLNRLPLLLDGESYEVIGVMPRTFRFPEQSDVWIPLTIPDGAATTQWTDRYLRVFGRLQRGQTLRSATFRMARISSDLSHKYPQYEGKMDATLIGIRDRFLGNYRTVMALISIGVTGMFFAVCANISGLLMSKMIGRQHELALQVALGADRRRLLAQTIVEISLLTVSGGIIGLTLAMLGATALEHLVPSAMESFVDRSTIESTMLHAACFVTFVATALSGIGPAAIVFRISGRGSLRPDVSVKSRVGFFRGLLVTLEVIIATVLLCNALSLELQIRAIAHVDLGFRPRHVLTLRTTIPMSPASDYQSFSARADLYRRVLARVAALPGVVSAGYTTYLPLINNSGADRIVIEGTSPEGPTRQAVVLHKAISANYLSTIGVRLLEGRYFDDGDSSGTKPVAIVNSSMAREYWPGTNPLGRRFRLAYQPSWVTVVGVVDDMRQIDLNSTSQPEMYFSCEQAAGAFGFYAPRDLAILVRRDPLEFAADVKDAIWSVVPDQAISNVQSMDAIVQNELAPWRMAERILVGFSVMALLLAGFGLYALGAYEAIQNNKESAVRIATGAFRSHLILHMVYELFTPVLAGCLIGVACEICIHTVLRMYSSEVPATSTVLYITVAFAVVMVEFAACVSAITRYMPSDLMKVLRYE